MMAAGTTILSLTCKLHTLPSEYFNSISSHEIVRFGNELSTVTLGPNTIVINRNSSDKLALNSRKNLFWALLTFCSSLEDLNKRTRLVQVVINDDVTDNFAFMSEDLLFNLSENCRNQECDTSITPRSKTITLINENVGERISPILSKANKVSIALFRSQSFLENSLIDNLLHKYFSFTRYLYCGDVFSVKIDETFLTNVSDIRTERVYFKVCDIEGVNDLHGPSIGQFVDSSITLVQVNSCHGYLPSRRVLSKGNPDFSLLLKNKELLENLSTHNQFLVPASLQHVFSTICSWIAPFLFKFDDMKGSNIPPVFLLRGSQGSGKCLLLEAVSQHLGINYRRVDCVTLAAVIPGQAESKIKALFSQLNTVAPCLLHLANIETLCQDGEGKEDVRVVSCFQQQVQSLQESWPVVIVASSHDVKSISLSIQQLFLDQASVETPDCQQRQQILSWLLWCCDASHDSQLREKVAAQTSGFGLRDLQVLVSLASKEKYKRAKEKLNMEMDFEMSDFSKIIGNMHKAYSEAIGAPKVPSVSWKDVGGLESLKAEILRSLRSNIFSTGLKRSGLLLHGPPGTGKTLLAKAVASQCGRNFLSVKGPELLNMYVGQSEHNVRDLFELAKVASPCIVFFDELDSLAPNRGRSGDSGGVMDRVVSQLLAEMDDLGSSGDVFILGATNRPDLIDPALLRPGRLDKLLYVGPCEDNDSKLSVLTALTHKLKLGEDVDLQEIVTVLPATVSGAQMSALCSTAWMSSARQHIKSGEHSSNTSIVLTKEDFLSAIEAVF